MKNKKEYSEAEVLNKLENKAKKGKATQRELNLLGESYCAFNVEMPEWFLNLYGIKGEKINE